jgi:hypothetical protein
MYGYSLTEVQTGIPPALPRGCSSKARSRNAA